MKGNGSNLKATTLDKAEMKITTDYHYATLSNGLRAVIVCRPSIVEYCGVAVGAGSRDELPGEEGLAHFVEHTIFKGTTHRRSTHIINRMELIGGELNAYTTKEETLVYSIFPAGNLGRAVELISDLVINSIFPDTELDKEREVVADEIDSYLDSPSDAVYDDFEDLIFSGSRLGHNILGTRQTLTRFNSESCRSFIERFYVAKNMVFFYLGPLAPDRVMSLVNRYLGSLTEGTARHMRDVTTIAPSFSIRRNDRYNHQAHNIIGSPIPSLFSPERHAMALLNNIIGGPGMNSRLNILLRERRGLVYSVESSTSLYTDAGLLTIYFGCDPEDTGRCRRIIEKELSHMSETPLSPRAIERAKRQFLGQLTISSASNEQLILSAARSTLYHGKARTAEEIADTITALNRDELLEAASLMNPEHCSILTLG